MTVGVQSSPIIVRIVEPEGELTGLANVLLGALGISGVLALGAIALGFAMAALVYWLRSRAEAFSPSGFLASGSPDAEPSTENPAPSTQHREP